MRIAFLTSLIPVARPDTGFEIANAAILDALRAAGHEVLAIGFLRPGEVAAEPEGARVIDHVAIENAAVGPMRKLGWIAAALRLGLPVACAKLKLAGRGRLVEAVKAAGPFDALVLNSVMLPGAFPELAKLAPFVLVEHNLEHVSARQNAAHAKNPLLRWLFAREARLLEEIETELAQAARFIWMLAEEDRKALAPELAAKAAVLPLVSGGSLPVSGGAASKIAHDIGLIGTWSWQPNRIGLDWFLNEVVPLLPPDISVAVAGRLPGAPTGLPKQVRLLGRVPDAAAFLQSCRLVALTSRAGTGVQLKTIEAMQLGLPAVATPLSCRGFTALPENFSVAEDSAAFAAALVRRVASIRAGQPQRINGEAFVSGQRAVLRTALERGLAATVSPRAGA